METAYVNGIDLEYEAVGDGEPVLLIGHIFADALLPLLSEPALAGRYHLIRYRKRGFGGSTHTPQPVSIADHATDAAALLEHLGVPRAHIAGSSSGADVAAQLALDRPECVHTLVLMEPTLFSVPSGEAFLAGAAPVLEAYAGGDHSGALAMFVSAASGLDWEECRALLDLRLSGAVANAVADADTIFGSELPAMAEWVFGPEQAAAISRPVLSVVGAETGQLWVEIAEFLRSSLPDLEEATIAGAGHLLQIQQPEPVARAMAQFLARHPIDGREVVPAKVAAVS
jgi:pimeloyl-ACP methyl ester carboxylesterase